MYLVNDFWGRWLLRAVDAVLKWAPKRSEKRSPIRRILICNLAHLGDVVLSTAILPGIRAEYPEAHIGFLAGSWAKGLLQDHPCIDQLHYVDHWKLSRAPVSKFQKLKSYFSQKKQVIRELQAAQYDIAIDLYPFFPNALSILYAAKIPQRAGFESGGFGPTLTSSLAFEKKEQGMAHYFVDLAMHSGLMQKLPLRLEPLLVSGQREVEGAYTVFHLGAGDVRKEWDLLSWKKLLERLTQSGRQVVFTGEGAREIAQVKEVAQGNPKAIDLSGRLSLKQLAAVIRDAQLVVTVDSLPAHMASAFQTKTVVLFTGLGCSCLWKPLGEHVKLMQGAFDVEAVEKECV